MVFGLDGRRAFSVAGGGGGSCWLSIRGVKAFSTQGFSVFDSGGVTHRALLLTDPHSGVEVQEFRVYGIGILK